MALIYHHHHHLASVYKFMATPWCKKKKNNKKPTMSPQWLHQTLAAFSFHFCHSLPNFFFFFLNHEIMNGDQQGSIFLFGFV